MENISPVFPKQARNLEKQYVKECALLKETLHPEEQNQAWKETLLRIIHAKKKWNNIFIKVLNEKCQPELSTD